MAGRDSNTSGTMGVHISQVALKFCRLVTSLNMRIDMYIDRFISDTFIHTDGHRSKNFGGNGRIVTLYHVTFQIVN